MTIPTQRGIGSVYGTSRDQAFDRWFRYPAGFSPDALALAAAAVNGSGRIVDPFFGSGSTAVGLAGRPVVGIETHPLIADLAVAKLARAPGSPDELRHTAAALVATASVAPADPKKEHHLVQSCFDADVLAQLGGLRDALASDTRNPWRRYLRWALLGTLRDVASVKVGWPYQRPALDREAPYRDAAARMLTRVGMIADDLKAPKPKPTGRVVRGDARSAAAWRRAAAGDRFAACVTSPPYLNNFDYADATRLELYFLKTVSTWREMCGEVRAGMVVATTQQSARARANRAIANLKERPSVGPELDSLTRQLRRERERRERGKEYDQVLPAYFADLVRVLSHLHRHTGRGATCAWVVGDSAPYGVYVDTPRLVGEVAGEVGFELIDDVTVRSRGLRWRTNGSRHQVPLTERLIAFRRP